MRTCPSSALLLLGLTLAACQGTAKQEDIAPDPLAPWEVRLQRTEARLAVAETFERRCVAIDLSVELARRRPEREERLAAAERGLSHARRAAVLRPTHPAGYYGLGVLTGLRLKNQLLPSLGGVKAIREEFLKAASCDESYRHGAPFRALGELYAQAPPWPTSIGDPDEAIHYFKEALRVDPDWPETRLLLAKALLDEDLDLPQVREHLDRASALLAQRSSHWTQVQAFEWQAELDRLRARVSGKA